MDALTLIVLGMALGIGVAAAGAAVMRRRSRSRGTGWARATRPLVGDTDLGDLRLGPHVSTVVTSREIETRVDADGLSISIDGRSYRSIDDVPDDGTRQHLREMLASLPQHIEHDDARASVTRTLEGAGIDVPDEVERPRPDRGSA